MVLRKRQKILLGILAELRKRKKNSKTYLMKCLFLIKKEMFLSADFYNFYPYKYGLFSRSVYADLDVLEREGLLDSGVNLTNKGTNIAKEISAAIVKHVAFTVRRFDTKEDIVGYVYETYPEYTARSELIPHHEKKKSPAIYTIGYEGKDIDAFLDILVRNSIDLLVDVRRNPFSMKFDFVKSRLAEALKTVGIEYVHIPELGIDSHKREALHSELDYKRLFTWYERNVDPIAFSKIISLGSQRRIALMCFEHDARSCHRGVLGRQLQEKGIRVVDL